MQHNMLGKVVLKLLSYRMNVSCSKADHVPRGFATGKAHSAPAIPLELLCMKRHGRPILFLSAFCLLQADFVVPSHRGEVDQDSRWNQLLRSKVPGLLVSALERFKALPVPAYASPLHWLDWWLRCIPLKSTLQVGVLVHGLEPYATQDCAKLVYRYSRRKHSNTWAGVLTCIPWAVIICMHPIASLASPQQGHYKSMCPSCRYDTGTGFT
jgi:hypothetical protein